MSKGKKKAKQPPRPKAGVADAVLTVIPIALFLLVRSFAGACVHEDGSPVVCATTAHVLTGLAIAGTVLCCLRILAADRATKRSFDLLLTIAGIAIAAMPGNMLPLCADTTMQCHTLMTPVARVLGVALIVGAILCELTVDHEEPTGRKRRR